MIKLNWVNTNTDRVHLFLALFGFVAAGLCHFEITAHLILTSRLIALLRFEDVRDRESVYQSQKLSSECSAAMPIIVPPAANLAIFTQRTYKEPSITFPNYK
jgi:hypothetical protein